MLYSQPASLSGGCPMSGYDYIQIVEETVVFTASHQLSRHCSFCNNASTPESFFYSQPYDSLVAVVYNGNTVVGTRATTLQRHMPGQRSTEQSIGLLKNKRSRKKHTTYRRATKHGTQPQNACPSPPPHNRPRKQLTRERTSIPIPIAGQFTPQDDNNAFTVETIHKGDRKHEHPPSNHHQITIKPHGASYHYVRLYK